MITKLIFLDVQNKKEKYATKMENIGWVGFFGFRVNRLWNHAFKH